MAIIKMRELLREPDKVFEKVDGGEPCLVTRYGKPLAALVPIDEAEAEKYLLAANERFAEDRRKAEHARAEGSTTPLEAVARRFGVEQGGEEEERMQSPGFPMRDEYMSAESLVRKLDGSLFQEFASAAISTYEAGQPDDAVFGKAVEQLREFRADVDVISSRYGDPTSVSFYAAYAMGGIGALERLRQIQRQEAGESTSTWVERLLGPPKPSIG